MLTQLRRFSPGMMLVAFVLVYLPKGFGQFLVDIQNLTIDKLQSKWQNIAMAAGAAVVMMMIKKLSMPAEIKTVAMFALYFIIGYNIAKTIDPPGGNYAVTYGQVPNNPYRNRFVYGG